MLDAIKDILSTVAVTSLNAYNFLSAGTKFPLCPIIAILILLTFSINCSSVSSTENPLNVSSLSIVPPVCPSPLPDILATGIPSDATKGVKQIEVLSPTPPVECLSTFTPFILLKSILSPDSTIALVKSAVSLLFILLKKIAISIADA